MEGGKDRDSGPEALSTGIFLVVTAGGEGVAAKYPAKTQPRAAPTKESSAPAAKVLGLMVTTPAPGLCRFSFPSVLSSSLCRASLWPYKKCFMAGFEKPDAGVNSVHHVTQDRVLLPGHCYCQRRR